MSISTADVAKLPSDHLVRTIFPWNERLEVARLGHLIWSQQAHEQCEAGLQLGFSADLPWATLCQRSIVI